MVGQVIGGRYQVVEAVHEGTGLFDLYLAKEVGTGFTVMLKQLREEWTSPGILPVLGQVLREQSRLNHPHLVSVMRQGVVESRLFLVEEFFSRSTLFDAMALKPPSIKQRLLIFQHILSAIGYIHTQGLYHGALCPTNIFIRRDLSLKVADPRIQAQLIEHLCGHDMIPPQANWFLAPEVLLGKPASSMSDTYSLGCLLYSCLSGWKCPFQKTDIGTLTTLLEENYIPLKKHGIESDQFDAIITKCLSTDPGQRYASLQQLSQDLQKALGSDTLKSDSGGKSKSSSGGVKRKKRFSIWRAINWTLGTTLALAILVVFSFLGFFIMERGPKGSTWYTFFKELYKPTSVVEVPGIEGKSLEDARLELARNGLRLRILDTIPSDKAPKGTILTQDPVGGRRVKPPRTILVNVSEGEKRVTLPSLSGYTWEEAHKNLSGLGLRVNPQPVYEKSETVPFGQVMGQTPKVGQILRPGEEVSLVISAGSKDEENASPILTKETADGAKRILEEKELPLFAKVFRYSQEPKDMVIGQNPPAGKPLASPPEPYTLEVSMGMYQTGLFQSARFARVELSGTKDDPVKVRVIYSDEMGEKIALEGFYAKDEYETLDIESKGETELILEVDGEVVYKKRY